jgi:hypothetical protein
MRLPFDLSKILPMNYAGKFLLFDDRPEAKSVQSALIGLGLGPVLALFVYTIMPAQLDLGRWTDIGRARSRRGGRGHADGRALGVGGPADRGDGTLPDCPLPAPDGR